MKILFVKPLENAFRVECHSMEDFRFIASFIHPNDLVSGETDRNIKPRQPGQKPFRLKMHLTLSVLSVDVDETTPSLRVSGTIEGGSPSEFVEMHAQHALVFNTYQPITVNKIKLFSHEIDQMRVHEKESQKPLYLSIVLDDEEAHLIQVSASGLKELGKINAQKSGKQFKTDSNEEKYFSKVAEIIFTAPQNQIILAGPGFAREGLLKYLNEHKPKGFSKTLLSVPTNDTGPKGIREALSNASITKALGQSRLAQEGEMMQDVLKHLGKDDGLAEYGFEEVERSVKLGAARDVLISTTLLSSQRDRVNALLEYCKQSGISYHILDVHHEPGKQLDGLSGIVSLLRYRMTG